MHKPLLLLLLIPSLLLYPQAHAQPLTKIQPSERLLTYDKILNLLDKIESGEFEKTGSPEELEKINRLLAFLANEGALQDGSQLALQKDIDELLSKKDHLYEYAYCMTDDNDFFISPAIFNGDVEYLLCKNWWKSTKNFLSKHKKEILIGAAIVVAATIIVVAAVTIAGTSAAATLAGAAASAASTPDEEETDAPTSNEPTPILTLADEAPILKQTLDEQIASLKEFLIEDSQQSTSSQNWDDLSFKEKARELGAFLAHKTFDDLSDFFSLFPELAQSLKDLGSQILPEGFSLPEPLNTTPQESYDSLVADGHDLIDHAFSTTQADLFTPQVKINDPNFVMGMLPLPEGLLKIFSNTTKLIENGKILDRAGFTKAGRSLMKHGYRQRSVFPKPVGTPKQVNEHGQKILESIVNHPEKQFIHKYTKRLGETVDIYAPGIGGVRYNPSGEVIGFLEP